MTSEDHHASITSSFLSHSTHKMPSPRYIPPNYTKPKKCVYFQKARSSNECPTIKESSKRWAIVKEQKLCFNCLGHHQSSACPSKFCCRMCTEKHHTSLCTEGQVKPEIRPPATNQTENPPAANQAENRQGTVVHTTMAPTTYFNIPSNTVTLLKTAIATVCNQSTYYQTNILFDEGAQRSFITKDLATQLQLQPTEREFIRVSGFGAQTSAARSLESTVINLKTL